MMNTTEKENKIVLKPWMLYFWTLLACSLFLFNTYCEDQRERGKMQLDRELDRELDERRMQMDYNIERSKMTPEELKRLQTIEENMRKYDEYNRKRK